MLTDAEIDHTLGLLSLREGERFEVVATPAVRAWLHEELPLGRVLASFCERPWRDLELDRTLALRAPHGGASGLTVRAFETGHGGPRYVGGALARGASIGLIVEDPRTGGRLVIVPSVPAATRRLVDACAGADALLMDGTFWSDDELSLWRGGHGGRTSHWAVGGARGSLAWLARQPIPYRAYIHINNTNPMLALGSSERRQTEAYGVRVSADGDALQL